MIKHAIKLLASSYLIVTCQLLLAQGEDPFIGTWDIVKEDSDFGGAPVPTAMSRSYAELGDGSYVYLVVSINANGELGGTTAVYRFDGKAYPLASLVPLEGALISYRKPNDRTVEYTVTLDGVVNQIGAKTLSLDSRVLTIAIQYPNSEQQSQILRFRRR